MNPLNNFFTKYNLFLNNEKEIKIIIAKNINLLIKKNINPQQIFIKKNIIKVNTSGPIKADIYINKQKILQLLKGELKDFIVLDIN